MPVEVGGRNSLPGSRLAISWRIRTAATNFAASIDNRSSTCLLALIPAENTQRNADAPAYRLVGSRIAERRIVRIPHAEGRIGRAVCYGELDLQVVGNCASIWEALAVLEREPVDVILLDCDLGAEHGTIVQIEAVKRGYKGRVLFVTAGMSDSEIVRALERGASGVFLKMSTPAQLIEAIHRVSRGDPWLDPETMKAVISAATGKSKGEESNSLTASERPVLKGIFEGLTNKEIAARLKISESSVKAIIQQLFDKIGVRTRGQLVRIALERRDEGWID